MHAHEYCARGIIPTKGSRVLRPQNENAIPLLSFVTPASRLSSIIAVYRFITTMGRLKNCYLYLKIPSLRVFNCILRKFD